MFSEVIVLTENFFSGNLQKDVLWSVNGKTPSYMNSRALLSMQTEREIMECTNSIGAIAQTQPEAAKKARSAQIYRLRDSAGRLRRAELRQQPHYGTLSTNRQPLAEQRGQS